MQTPTVYPQRQEWVIQTSAPTLRAKVNIMISESSSVPSDETGKALANPQSVSAPWPVI